MSDAQPIGYEEHWLQVYLTILFLWLCIQSRDRSPYFPRFSGYVFNHVLVVLTFPFSGYVFIMVMVMVMSRDKHKL